MVEDENPPAYEPVSLNDPETTSLPGEPALVPGTKKPANGRDATQAVSSSFRGLNRLIRSYGGFRAYLRGIVCFSIMVFVASFIMSTLSSTFNPLLAGIGTIVAYMATLQLNTAWIHIIITPGSSRTFWRRLPPLKLAFTATWKPLVVYWLASEGSLLIVQIASWALGIDVFTVYQGNNLVVDGIEWKFPVLFLISLATLVLTIPAHVVLVRIQASLLPAGEDTIIPFDRSFAGKVEPAVVSGKGYATISDAWSTFSGAAWRRLGKLYVKVILVNAGITFAIAGLVFAQLAIVNATSRN